MKSPIFGMMALVCVASASVAGAQSFTYTSNSNPPTTMVGGAPAGAAPFGASAWTGTTELMMEGKKIASTFTCIAMSQPEKSKIFDSHMICNGGDATGTWTSVWGCNGQQATGMGCWGGLFGQTGVYANRRGVLSGSGKGTMQMGTGHWDK
ncbi:hypothetical protein [Sandarakinorhabdus rubra]|uniref:hypothetical protein n=1 Tax=Sandarakinorhabdus rubra TaxID=2672568 RepID=UPI0013DA84E7|nr:hypothetical protein [Sandarakinorhabdus rubra]